MPYRSASQPATGAPAMYATATTAMTAEATAGGRPTPDDVENDEALQTREAELPECVHHAEDAQTRVPSQQRTKRRGLIRKDSTPAAGFEPEYRQQGQRHGRESARGDQEWERLPNAEQQTARQQRRAETDTTGDCLYGLRAGVEPSRQEVGVEGPVRWVVDVVADEEREHRDRGDRRRSAEREDGEPCARERRTRNDKGQPTTVRRGRQPIRERTGGKRDDERKCPFSANQRAYGGRRMDEMDQDHRPVRREHRDCEGEAEGRQAQQHQ